MAETNTKLSLRTNDPIQGHDVIAKATGYGEDRNEGGDSDEVFSNVFTDIMFKIVSQTEVYLSLTSRVPRYLDGEVIIVWQCSAGTLSLNFVKETFGSAFNAGLKQGRTQRIRRSSRFTLDFSLNSGETADSASLTNPKLTSSATTSTNRVTLLNCRCDSLSFGVQSGKGYAVNQWQGTAEGYRRSKDSSLNSDVTTAAAPTSN